MDRHWTKYFFLVSLGAFKVLAQPKFPELTCANKLDCNVVRLQQYFCIARCISFVRDEAPSSLTNNGTCPAVNWWYKPTTTTTAAPTTVAATTAVTTGTGGTGGSSSGDSCAGFTGYEGCCKKEPYDDLFPDDDEDCKHDPSMTKSQHKAAKKDSTQMFKFVSATGELVPKLVEDHFWYYYDCLFKKNKLYDNDGEFVEKKITSYLKKTVTDADQLEDAVPKCMKLAKKIPNSEEKYNIKEYDGNVKVYQACFVFNLCMRRELWSGCKKEKSEACRAGMDTFTNKCALTISKK